MSFGDRTEQAKRYAEETAETFREYELVVSPYGVEDTLSEEAKNTICGDKYRKNLTASFIRFSPDEVVIVENKAEVFLCEVKSAGKEYQNYSYELDSYEIGRELARNGVNFFTVFNAEKAARIEKIQFNRIVIPKSRWSSSYVKKVKKKYPNVNIDYKQIGSGSKTPYGLISKNSLFLRSLEEFIEEELLH